VQIRPKVRAAGSVIACWRRRRSRFLASHRFRGEGLLPVPLILLLLRGSMVTIQSDPAELGLFL